MNTLFIILAVIYLFRFLIMSYGIIKEKWLNRLLVSNSEEFSGFISIIIPARNEESNIENAIHSISQSNYPLEKYEIIAVNDRSSDKTAEILNKLKTEIANLKVVHITEDSQKKNLKGKPGAIQAGIDVSIGDIIMMTDADCIVNPDWISTVSSYFTNEKVGLVPSFTLIKSTSIFGHIQALEWLYLHTLASGGVGLNKPMGCYGNNLTVRKNAFDKVGGYEKIKFSVTEDLSLLQAIHRAGFDVHYVTDYKATVTTLPLNSFKEYVSQKRRWALGGLSLGWIASAFVLTTISVWLGFILSLTSGNYLIAFLFLILRMLIDFVTYTPSAIKLKQSKKLLYSPIALPFFFIFELLIPFLLINTTIEWKGQKFNKNS